MRYSNGSATPVDSMQLSGTVNPGDVFVVINGQDQQSSQGPASDPALRAMADQLDGVYPAPSYFNGDDAVTLVKIQGSNRVFVDIFGRIGEDPGTAWTSEFPYNDNSGRWLTANHTLIRKSNVQKGVTTNPANFNTFGEWDTLPSNTWTNVGSHQCSCRTAGIATTNAFETQINLYPNPINHNSKTLTIVTELAYNAIEIYNTIN